MDHATCSRLLLATHFATSLLPLTARLVPVIAELGRLIVRSAGPTPRLGAATASRPACRNSLRELGRIIVEWTFNHLEPHDHKDLPGQIESGGTWYRRRSKTPNRSVATLFGTITLWRMLYQDVHGVEPSIFPLEIRLGLESGQATPALAERAARAAVTLPQDAVLATLRDDHAVSWSATSLRAVIADVAAGMEAHRQDAQADRLLALAGAGGPVLGRSQAGAGGGPRRVDVADPWPGVLPGGGHGDGVGLRPKGTAIGDGLPGEDA